MPEPALKKVEPTDEEQWEQRLTEVARASDQSQWAIGDLIIEADEGWGDTYTRAEQITGKPCKTLRNYVYVCSKFDLSRRRDNLTFGHHAAVAAKTPKDQDEWLNKAEKGRWTVTDLKTKLRSPANDHGIDPKDRYVVLVPRKLTPKFVKAADAQEKTVPEWLLGLGNEAVSA